MSPQAAEDLAARSMQALEAELEIPADLEVTLLDRVAGDLAAQSMQALEAELEIPTDLEATLLDRVAGDSSTRTTRMHPAPLATANAFYKGLVLKGLSTKPDRRASKHIRLGLCICVMILAATWARTELTRLAKTDAVNIDPDAGQTEEHGSWLLEQAQEKLALNDVAGAHELVLRIPSTSPVRGNPSIERIEGAWADAMFVKLDENSDLDFKKEILNTINATPTVDATRREKAAHLLLGIQARTTSVAAAATTSVAAAPKESPPVAASPRHASAVAHLDTRSRLPVFLSTKGRGALEWKVSNGLASVEEIRTLMDICSRAGDLSCRDRAAEMLKEKPAPPSLNMKLKP